jgi:hypothetical protein
MLLATILDLLLAGCQLRPWTSETLAGTASKNTKAQMHFCRTPLHVEPFCWSAKPIYCVSICAAHLQHYTRSAHPVGQSKSEAPAWSKSAVTGFHKLWKKLDT